jgi:hypothetical protein
MSSAQATRPATQLGVRMYRPGDEQAIIDMIEACFHVQWTTDRWSRWFEHGPHGPGRIHILERDGRPVGHFAHIGLATFVDGQRVLAGRGGVTMVLPECQGQGGMRSLVEAFLADDHGFALRVNFPNDKAKVLIQRYGGGRHVGQIPRFARSQPSDVRGARSARLLVRSGLATLYGKLASWPAPRGLTVEELTDLGAEVDALAEASGGFARCVRVRDAAYMRWRWLGRPEQPVKILGARDRDGVLKGMVVCTVNEAGHGHIVDVVALDAPSLRALLIAGTDELFAQGRARVVLDYLDPRPWAQRAVRRAGFLAFGGGMSVIVGAVKADPGVERLDAWYLTAGDSERC